MNEPIPDEIGVIVLPGTVLFPHALLPLYIFESRYQLMLDHALETGRVFAVGTRRPSGGGDDAYSVGGAGVIRACVRNPDGTSNLVLQGLRRVKFLSWTQTEPYRVARVAPLESRNAGDESTGPLAAVVHEICEALDRDGKTLPPQFEKALSQIADADTLSDAVSSALIADPELRRQLFEELDVPTRMRGLMRCLRVQLGKPDEP
jgi:Lon protease-like protein